MKRLSLVLLLSIAVNCAAQVAPKPSPAKSRPDINTYPTYESYIEALVEWKINKMQSNSAQAARPSSLPTLRSALREALDAQDAAQASLSGSQSQIEMLTKSNAELAEKNKALAAEQANLKTIIAVLRAETSGHEPSAELKAALAKIPSGPSFDDALAIEKSHGELVDVLNKVVEHDKKATEQYNSLLADYKTYVERVGVMLGQVRQQNAISNALSFYSLMPKYQPPQTINVTFSDCTRFPALCIH